MEINSLRDKYTHDSLFGLLYSLWIAVSHKRRMDFIVLLVMMVFASFAEVLSIGSLIPFLGAILDPKYLYELNFIRKISYILEIQSPEELRLAITFVFGVLILTSGTIRLLLLKLSIRFSFQVGAELSANIYYRALHQPYLKQINRNSSKVIDGVMVKVQIVINAFMGSLQFISAIVMLTIILLGLLAYHPLITLYAIIIFGSLYLLIYWCSRKVLQLNSEKISTNSKLSFKILNEGLGGIRDILIDGTQAIFCKIFSEVDAKLRIAQGENLYISQRPRYIIESLGMLAIVISTYFYINSAEALIMILPTLAVFTLASQRLLPTMQQLFQSWSAVKGSRQSMIELLTLINEPLPKKLSTKKFEAIEFNTNITLNNLDFRYDNSSPWIINNFSLNISKGTKVGFIGKSGCGKSTLLDIIMGLIVPVNGYISIDGVVLNEANTSGWQAKISHVPQFVFMSDSSISENIAFGAHKDDIDYARVFESARKAKISDYIDGLSLGYETTIGERGVRLSGGQRQRIGIARALYKGASLIIFDEATSALDSETEDQIMETIDDLSGHATIIVVAHRLSTLKKCQQIIQIENGSAKQIFGIN
jgi:ABC-type bacteriocin/lantibiotic exporter with double-glycine peptidase domain